MKDYVFSYKAKTPEGCSKRMVIIFHKIDNNKLPIAISIVKLVIVKKETAEQGDFSEKNGFILLRKFSKFHFYKQSILIQTKDLFHINDIYIEYFLNEPKPKPKELFN